MVGSLLSVVNIKVDTAGTPILRNTQLVEQRSRVIRYHIAFGKACA